MRPTHELWSSKSFILDHSIFQSPNDVDTHIHDCYELFYFISGDLTYYIEGHAYDLKPNDLIVTNTKELHRIIFHSDANYERKYIHFKSDFLSAYQTKEYNLLNYVDLLEKQFFVNKYYLSHTFKKITGISPREYSSQ